MTDDFITISNANLHGVTGGKAEPGIDLPPPGRGCFPPIDTTRIPSPFGPTDPPKPAPGTE